MLRIKKIVLIALSLIVLINLGMFGVNVKLSDKINDKINDTIVAKSSSVAKIYKVSDVKYNKKDAQNLLDSIGASIPLTVGNSTDGLNVFKKWK